MLCLGETVAEAIAKATDNLHGVDITGANLMDADLSGQNLRGVDLMGANLTRANFTDCNMRGINLTGADVTDANFTNAELPWYSYEVLAEILRQAAGEDVSKLKMAGLVLILRDKFLQVFLKGGDPDATWALGELRKREKENDNSGAYFRRLPK